MILHRQYEQLGRLLYPSLSAKDDIPILLPLSTPQQSDPRWIEVDFKFQLILAQVLRIAVLPWYSKITNDREIFQEVANVVRYSLYQLKEDLISPSNHGLTRLERLILLDVPSIFQIHYVEVQRALEKSLYDDSTPLLLYIASNPHPALKLIDNQIHIDENHIDILLLAILQRLLPKAHSSAQTEVLIVIDVIKGLARAQLRNRGNGMWVVVRLLSNLVDEVISQKIPAKEVKMENDAEDFTRYNRARILLGLNFVYVVFKTIILCIATFYLELFSPVVEPRRRGKRRKSGVVDAVRLKTGQRWNLSPFLDAIVVMLKWRDRTLTRFVEEWIRIMLVWGGDWLVERQVKVYLQRNFQPEKLLNFLELLHSVVPSSPDQPPTAAATAPSIEEQQNEYQKLVTKLVKVVQTRPSAALLLGRNDSMQRKCIEDALFPILGPPSGSSSPSITQVANIRSALTLLERAALLLNPLLEL